MPTTSNRLPRKSSQESIEKERPDALAYPTMGGQTGGILSLCSKRGCAEKFKRRDDAARESRESIEMAEDATFSVEGDLDGWASKIQGNL